MLSVIIPVFNEVSTIRDIIALIRGVPIDKEIIVVDDGSSDGTAAILNTFHSPDIKVIHHAVNRGKGAAVATGIAHSRGEYLVIQDADLEYDPNDYVGLLKVMNESSADLVMGARFTSGYHGLFIPRLGNQILTTAFNILFRTSFNDVMTCYKLFRTSALEFIEIKASDFNIEIEFLAKACRNKLSVREVPITYKPRNYNQGKKIRIFDGFKALTAVIHYRLRN
jgi:glycosyltransferase involved in cell wall biosynthesis